MNIPEILLKHGYNYGSGVPCSILKDELKEIGSSSHFNYINAVDEKTALGIVNGFTVGGKKSFLITQNSAVGEVLDLVMSFNRPYNVPLFWIITMRGYEGDTEVHRRAFEFTFDTVWQTLPCWLSTEEDLDEVSSFERALKYHQSFNETVAYLKYKDGV